MNTLSRRFFTNSREQNLPLYMESIGFNGSQERIERPNGYPCFHWLETYSGEGVIKFNGTDYIMRKGSGVLLLPNERHQYYAAAQGNWETVYLTFSGPQVSAILSTLGLHQSCYFQWDEDVPFQGYVESILDTIVTDQDLSGLDASADLYRFLILLKKYGRIKNTPSISHAVNRLSPLIAYMEQHYHDPDIGLEQMAEVLGISTRHLNTLFKQSFGMTAYAYFILIRIRKAKELLIEHPNTTIKEISRLVGFRDASHFVATFRRIERVTPEQYRTLY
ncbi:AraC family transcriptional regulator [Paenibacillus sediminis]|uniref:AraC-like DNA-binding protein n=1 Tax=Paenibacillus sediminis TaxID=664909 RepID=A0ABS4H277_9BACL|nr:AraC family transcriptional regulator [Paenibacillus sediminis]MBP1936477.1 AraC-like DNA-binding protein [Paenibacillus sediminis]